MIECRAPALFLSDCHLPLLADKERNTWTKKVQLFLNTEGMKCKTLFLVGDLFDFWFEWNHCIPARSFQVLTTLRNLVDAGIEIHYLAGNHDGHPGWFLKEEVGLKTTRGHVDASIDGKKFHIIHGDGVARGDRNYRILRALVRWKHTEKLYRLLHPDLGIRFAGKVSKGSMSYFSYKDKFGVKPYLDYAFSKIDNGFDYVIMGHRHSADYVEHGKGAFVGIGNWIRKGSYGLFENGGCSLEYF
ncbi:UDP-2,3-diacylglucosamine diphosphatase [bacterium]|nr:UDP-2,3-diacylglucosamine diphosphatase [bacterium]